MRRAGRAAALGMLWLGLAGFGDTAWFAAREGADKYAKGDFTGALESYLDAQRAEPDDRVIDYNLGGAYFKTGKFDDAVKAYGRALASDDPALRERAAFNQGAALLGKGEAAMKTGDMQTARGALEHSAERYREIVRHDKTNADARRNLELALVRLRELEELPPQEKKEDQRRDQQAGQEGKEQPQSAPAKQKKQDTQPEQGESAQAQKSGAKERRPVPGEMTKKEARMILNAIEQDEAEVKRGAREKMMRAADEEKVEKDW